jgi:sn-glycerol 3-phosphate transport system ATP-binding protein
MSEIAVEEVTKAWGAALAVDHVSFTAKAGELLVLLGPSGCGKSTTLRLIAGLEDATSGTISIAGRDVTQLPPSARQIAMVFQSYALFPHLSVAENIVFGLKVRKVPTAERDSRLKRVADLVGLSHLLDRRPSQLSGGQRQRVALGRAIIAEAPVCLMDEPLSNLDAQLRQEMRAEIRSLQQRLGITMVYVTHDQTEAMTMADQIILLRDGRIEHWATPDEIYARPATAFTARFIGTPPMNLLRLAADGTIDGGSGPAVLAGPGNGLLLGVRPEHMRFADRDGVAATVGASEYLGADTVVLCRIGDQALALRAPGRARVTPGETVNLTWDTASAHLFDADTGARRNDEARAPAPRSETVTISR